MNISLANLESFQEAIRQASKVIKCPNASERLELADKMRKGVTCDFFQLDLNDDDDDDNFDEQNSSTIEENSKAKNPFEIDSIGILSRFSFSSKDPIVFLPQIQNDQEFIETMINHGRRKRQLTDENPNCSNRKLKRLTMKNEPEQVR